METGVVPGTFIITLVARVIYYPKAEPNIVQCVNKNQARDP
jgi:hypothetical protein